MLVEFSLANFRSFKNRATLSLEASPDDWLEESHVVTVGNYRLLKSAAIYGANAGGKSNFLTGMRKFCHFVQTSSRESQIGEKIPVVPFRLHTATESAPSHFEVVFLKNGTRYRYGFEATAEKICAEWLFSQKDSIRETRLFTREESVIESSLEFKEGKGLEQRTRPNALFLSVVSQFNGPIGIEIMSWIGQLRSISGMDDIDYLRFTGRRLEDEQSRARIREIARRADVGIEDLRFIESPEADGGFSIKAVHKKFGEQGEPCGVVEFDLEEEESSGTLKFVAMSGPFLHTLEEGAILAVDEMEARFHPILTKSFVGLFNGVANQRNAQLIYATHDDGLLDAGNIRRDQIWFVEKDEFGASQLFSLAEFKVQKGAKFAKEYLLGEFGAIPHIRTWRRPSLMRGSRAKPWEKGVMGGRIVGTRNRRRVVILCEDEKSARLYFEGFRLDTRRIEVLSVGTGMNTDSLVQNAIERKKAAILRGNPFNEIWCVFDRDSFPARNFNRAFQLADNHGIQIGWANEAFEIWYLLHFNFHDTGMSRTEYAGRLGKLLRCKYDKADDQMYARLEQHQSTAIRNARRLEQHWIESGGCDPERANPSTSIHKLVEFLNQFKELGPADSD